MVSKFTGWLKKSLATAKPSQPDETDEGPNAGADQLNQDSSQQNSREARFSGRAERGQRDSFKQNRAQPNHNADRRRQAEGNQQSSNINFSAQNRAQMAADSSTSESPDKRRRSGQAEDQYQPGELPPDFHRRVVDLEIKVEMNGVHNKDNEKQIRMLSDLMQLYSAAIEHYNRTRDEENYSYYIEKLQKLNTQIRTLIEREERNLDRMKEKKQKKTEARKSRQETTLQENKTGGQQPLVPRTNAAYRPSTQGGPASKPQGRASSIQPPKLNKMERVQMRHSIQMALETKKMEKPVETEKQMDKHFEEEKEAQKKLEKDMVNQKDRLQQRLAERKRSKAMRATSHMANQTLPLNLTDSNKNDISGANLQVPMMQTSAMHNDEHSPLKKSSTLRVGRIRDDDTFSQGNRSTTTQGGGLANKIGQAVSRILSQSQANGDITQDEDEVSDLVNLLNELNAHHDLTVKLSNQSKIIKFLNEAADAAGNGAGSKPNVPAVKDYKVTIGKAKSEFGRLGFQSKMRLEMKQLMIDPKVKEIVDQSRVKLEKLQEDKDDEIEEFQEEHAEAKYKANQKVKQKFKVQIALATKQKDSDKKAQLEQQQKDELKRVETEMQEKGVEGKNKIKERFNELAQQVTIDTSGFMSALLKKKELRRLNPGQNDSSIEESKHNNQDEDVSDMLEKLKVGGDNSSPSLEEGDTLESTPTPNMAKSKSEQQEARVEDMLDQIDQINL